MSARTSASSIPRKKTAMQNAAGNINVTDAGATDVKIFDVRTRKMLKSFTAQGTGAQSILDKQIGELSRQISRGVGLSKRAVEETAPQMAQVPSRSMEAVAPLVDQLAGR